LGNSEYLTGVKTSATSKLVTEGKAKIDNFTS